MDSDLEDAILAYAIGNISDSDKEALELRARNDKSFAIQLALAVELVRQGRTEKSPAKPTGWEQLKRELHGSDETEAGTNQITHLNLHRKSRVRRFAPALQMAAGAALGIVIWQSSVGSLFAPDSDVYNLASEASKRSAAQIIFKDTATNGDIRAMLNQIDASIYSGPSYLGIYRIVFETAEARDLGIAILKEQTEQVEFVGPDN